MPQTTTILWDWNGTLLDDVEQSIDSINEMLRRRQLPQLSRQRYLDIFNFPVYNYYENIGFDFTHEEWPVVANEYMTSYHNKEQSFKLFHDARSTLEKLQNKNIKHYIISAMKTDSLRKMLSFHSIEHYFDGVYGLDNQYANGKIDLAHSLLKQEHLSPENCLLVGDTTHDAEVARSIGVKCHLITKGHHSINRLKATKFETYDSLTELVNKL